jgi:exonuclease VII large subunit
MQPYENSDQHLNRRMKEAAKRYMAAQKAGFQSSKRLEKALAERTLQTAREDWQDHAYGTFQHNVQHIQQAHKQRMKQLDREGALLAGKTCPPIMMALGFLAWWGFSQGNLLMGLLYLAGALAFLSMLIVAVLKVRH